VVLNVYLFDIYSKYPRTCVEWYRLISVSKIQSQCKVDGGVELYVYDFVLGRVRS